jgi:6-pyruvoyltetrahydropterin/6-carboxytetrahydropterin synthase
MTVIRVTKEFSFEMAHALEGYDGACRQIHGHSYRLWVTVKGVPRHDSSPKRGMVVDFGELKRIVNEGIVERYDHALVVRRTADNEAVVAALREHYAGVVVVDWQPTSENLVAEFVSAIRAKLPVGVELCAVRLAETATSYAEWLAEDNK